MSLETKMLPEVIISGAKDPSQLRASFDLALSLASTDPELDECSNGELEGGFYQVYWAGDPFQEIPEEPFIVVQWRNPEPS